MTREASLRTHLLPPRSIARGALSSAVATGSDFALVALMIGLLSVQPSVATFVGCLAGGAIHFGLSRSWTFASQARPGPQALRYLLVTTSSAALNALLIGALLLWPGVSYPLAWWLVRGTVFTAWSHRLNRDFVFR
jgi:putative flippase GtrA